MPGFLFRKNRGRMNCWWKLIHIRLENLACVPLACLPRAHPFFLVLTTFKRLLRGLWKLRIYEKKPKWEHIQKILIMAGWFHRSSFEYIHILREHKWKASAGQKKSLEGRGRRLINELFWEWCCRCQEKIMAARQKKQRQVKDSWLCGESLRVPDLVWPRLWIRVELKTSETAAKRELNFGLKTVNSQLKGYFLNYGCQKKRAKTATFLLNT